MKVVLFCGGLGTRLREYSETIPKPMVPIGHRPILWHIMKYYAHHGHTEFILCLGYRGDMIREYFLNYNECLSNDFTLSDSGKRIELHSSDISDWKITFVDTGLNANIGQRLMAVREHLGNDAEFCANYADGLTDCSFDTLYTHFRSSGKIASLMCVQPMHSYHVVSTEPDGNVRGILPLSNAGLWINGGYFILKKEIFDFMKPGEELVDAPFKRLIEKNQLTSYVHPGFWASMDTFKDKQMFDDMNTRGERPWEIWKK
jgi:glucose-1-phosphate cytidylyltransferase